MIMKMKKRSIFCVIMAVLLVSILTAGTLIASGVQRTPNEIPDSVMEILRNLGVDDLTNVTFYETASVVDISELGLSLSDIEQMNPDEFASIVDPFLLESEALSASRIGINPFTPFEYTLSDVEMELLTTFFGDEVDFTNMRSVEGENIPDNVLEHIRHLYAYESIDFANMMFFERLVVVDVSELGLSAEEFFALNENELMALATPYLLSLPVIEYDIIAYYQYADVDGDQIASWCFCYWCLRLGRCPNPFSSCHSLNISTVMIYERIWWHIGGGIWVHGGGFSCRLHITQHASCSFWLCRASGSSGPHTQIIWCW